MIQEQGANMNEADSNNRIIEEELDRLCYLITLSQMPYL